MLFCNACPLDRFNVPEVTPELLVKVLVPARINVPVPILLKAAVVAETLEGVPIEEIVPDRVTVWPLVSTVAMVGPP